MLHAAAQNGRMKKSPLRQLLLACIAGCAAAMAAAAPPATPQEAAALYQSSVDRRLDVPIEEVHRYAHLADQAFVQAGVVPDRAQYVVVVDRDARVQAVLLMWRSAAGSWLLVGASPVSTGRPGTFDHFETPVGVFDHTGANPDFRAEGTLNSNGIRGYGDKGMRVFDFGWQRVAKSWGDRQVIDMRLQMHATDADLLEQRLGTAQSKGCVRIPATLNTLLDHYGLLDEQYERLARDGRRLWVLHEDREPAPDAGRYLVVVDTARSARPDWSPLPVPARKRAPVKR